MGYLTPNTIPTTTSCRILFVPDSLEFNAIVTGAIEQLTFAESWVTDGATTPQQCADLMLTMWNLWCFRIGTCRMIGEIIQWAGTISPDPNWLECDGSSLLRSDYPDLFIVIGTTYGAIDAAHFNLPDNRGRTLVSSGTGSGLTARAVGQSFGEETHTLTTAEEASHSHVDSGHVHSEGNAIPTTILVGAGAPLPSAIPSVGVTGTGNASLSSSGGDGAHNNMQPSLVMMTLIVAA